MALPWSAPQPEALVFDAFGTLLNIASVNAELERQFPGKAAAIAPIWRAKQLEYSWLMSLMGRYEPFSQLTERALAYACMQAGVERSDEASQALQRAYLHLKAYDEVAAALSALYQQGKQLAVLSNADAHLLRANLQHNGLLPFLRAVLSVEALQCFKPDPRVYQLACERLALSPERVAFFSSNYWDVMGAASFGLRVGWVRRSGMALPDALPFSPQQTLTSLNDLL